MDIKVVESENEIYQKQKLLGEGAFGKAYLVKRKSDNQLLVIKEMSIEHMSQQERNQTIKEAQILRNLNHPNIVKFVEVYVTKQNKLKIVMEYAECGDLSKAINQRKKSKKYFTQNQILDWFTQICLAIKHVHDRKILHRDIKGQNIFITKTNTLKLGDFGIARVLNKTMEKARTVVGTPYYLSPEIIQNKPYSFQSDIWSIGVVLYELCALTHPFTATSLQFLALKIVKGSFTPIPNQYSKDLRSLVNSMLSLDPNRRPTINQIFKYSIVQDRIKNFLTQTKRDHEFSHTILHNHKVQIFTNKLVQMKQQKDFQKQRQKLKQQEQMIRQKLQQKKSQQRLRVQQQQRQKQIQRERQKQVERQRLRSVQRQKIKQRQEKSRQEMAQKQRQRKQFQRRQSVLEQQRRKQEQQKRMQKEYEENRKMAKYFEQKAKQDDQVERLRRQHAQIMYRQTDKNEDVKKSQKMKKIYEKQQQEERKKKQLQQFARKQFFENQQIMRRAKQRARQQEAGYEYEPSANQIQPEEKLPNFGNRNTADNFHYQNKSSQQSQSPYDSRNVRAQTKPQFHKETNTNKNTSNAKNYAMSSQMQKKHSSVRDQMKKDRQNFMRNKNHHQEVQEPQIISNRPPILNQQNPKTIKAAKWQRPSSRGNQQQQQTKPTQHQEEQQTPSQDIAQSNDKTYVFMEEKVSPKDQANFNQYLIQLQNLLQNLNKNVEEIQNNKNKKSPSKLFKEEKPQYSSPEKSDSKDSKALETKNEQQKSFLSDMPEEDEVIYRDDDHQTFELSLTASFNKQVPKQTGTLLPQIDASTDLELFSNFSKLETLRMNLQDKFGTDKFVQLYRFLQNEMNDKGIEAFSNQDAIISEAVRKFNINEDLLYESFTLLLTLIHMEEKMMSGQC